MREGTKEEEGLVEGSVGQGLEGLLEGSMGGSVVARGVIDGEHTGTMGAMNIFNSFDCNNKNYSVIKRSSQVYKSLYGCHFVASISITIFNM